MVVVGVDAHKRTHTCVAVDGSGRKLGEKTVPATTVGNASALRWARSTFGPDLTWGIEDVRNVSRRLEQELVKGGQRVGRVPTHLMARTRAFARTRGKSDSIDATAVARAVLREPDLPVAQHDSVSRELQLLTERRETLVDQRTATVNGVQWRIHELDPVRSNKLKPLIYAKHRDPVAAWLAEQPGLVAELACDELDDIARLTQLINALEKRIVERVRVHARHLLALPGCVNRPRFYAHFLCWKDGAMSIRYDENTKARAVRLVREHRDDYESEWAAMKAISGRPGMNPETLRKWVRQTEINAGEAPGVSSEERRELRELRRKNRELESTIEILKAATSFFARECDPRHR